MYVWKQKCFYWFIFVTFQRHPEVSDSIKFTFQMASNNRLNLLKSVRDAFVLNRSLLGLSLMQILDEQTSYKMTACSRFSVVWDRNVQNNTLECLECGQNSVGVGAMLCIVSIVLSVFKTFLVDTIMNPKVYKYFEWTSKIDRISTT